MNFAKISMLSAALFAACGAFADAANTLITFSTPGPDKFADGTTVDGNAIYALVWSADGDFNGFTAEGKAVDDNDEVILTTRATGDHCGLTLFQIDSKSEHAHADGVYAVYMLDARDPAGHVTGAALAQEFAGAAGTGNIAKATSEVPVDSEGNSLVKTDATIIGGDTTAIAPIIKGIKIDGAQVTISVGNLVPGLSYTVMGGLKRDAVVEKVGFQDATEANIVIESTEKFFSIKAE